MNESTLDQTCRTIEDIAKDAYAQGRYGAQMEAQRTIAMLLEACEDALEFVADQEDTVDGDYGIPEPNKAMRVASMLREAIEKGTKQ